MKRRNVKTTIKDIVSYWEGTISECELNFDWSEAHERCWRCGYKRKLQRCHIIPDSLGGEDAPYNLVLLCDQCHKEAPNVQDSKFIWDWIKSYHAPFYDTFWNKKAIDEYQNIYHKDFLQELKDRNIVTYHAFHLFWNLKIGKVSHHFGQPYGNVSTTVGELKMRLNAFDQKYKNGKYKSDKLIQKEKNFEDFTNSLCFLCYKNHWSVLEGSTKNPYTICISAFYPNIRKHKAISIRIDKQENYNICYPNETNPNNVPSSAYSTNWGNNPKQVIEQIELEILKFNDKYGNPDVDTAYLVSDPIWSHRNDEHLL